MELQSDKKRIFFKLQQCHGRIVARKIQLQFWCFGFEGGNDPYLLIRDLKKYGKGIIEFANDINCITASTAIQLALDIHNSRYTRSIKFLYNLFSTQHTKLVHP